MLQDSSSFSTKLQSAEYSWRYYSTLDLDKLTSRLARVRAIFLPFPCEFATPRARAHANQPRPNRRRNISSQIERNFSCCIQFTKILPEEFFLLVCSFPTRRSENESSRTVSVCADQTRESTAASVTNVLRQDGVLARVILLLFLLLFFLRRIAVETMNGPEACELRGQVSSVYTAPAELNGRGKCRPSFRAWSAHGTGSSL